MVDTVSKSKKSPKIAVITSTILTMDNDTSVFERIKDNDKGAFEHLFKKHYLRLCHYAFQYSNNMPDAEELVQELFLNIWERRSTIEINTSFKSYLYQSVKNKGLNSIRNKQRRQGNLLNMNKRDYQNSDADSNLALEDINDKLFTALEKLPPKCRRIFRMSRIEGLKHKEIAQKMDLAEKTVENQIGIALRKLKIQLSEYLKSIVLYISFTNI